MEQYPYEARRYPLIELLPAAAREADRRLTLLLVLFVVIAMTALVVGYFWPKTYVASTSVLVNEDNIIQELMEGRAVPTSVHDRRLIAREVMFSRRVMDEVLQAGGLVNDATTRAEREQIARLVEERTVVSAPRENLLLIEYRDNDPQRAFAITARFSELLISESRAAKLQESLEAYEFIAEQVVEYQEKLGRAEAKLSAYRESSPEARPGSLGEVNIRISELRRNIESWNLELLELRSRKTSLEAQLASESSEAGIQSWESQLRRRIGERQDELDDLLMELTPRHPDVVRVRGQVEQLRAELAQTQDPEDGTTPAADEDRFATSALHADLVARLGGVERDISALESRIAAAGELLDEERERALIVTESETGLAELSRSYDVNKEIYQDLLRRQENARLSLSLDEQGRGLTFSVQEPPEVPARASGIRFLHLAGTGLAAAFAVPLGLTLALVRLDPRVRSAAAIERQSGLPVIGEVFAVHTAQDRRRRHWRMIAAIAVAVLVLAAYAGVGWIKLVEAM